MYKFLLLAIAICTATLALDSPANEELPIKDLMLSRITAASNILWSVEDPQSEAEWQVFDDAALELTGDFERLREGGSGSNDKKWASEAAWQKYINEEIVALDAARQAIKMRDLEKLWEANDALYTPCETCHIEFNPGVAPDNR